jgi:hypothetical protein
MECSQLIILVDESQEASENASLSLVDDDIDAELPSVSRFALPSNTYQQVFDKQGLPELHDLHVAYPKQHKWQSRQDEVRRRPVNLFLANPPPPDPKIRFNELQQATIDLIMKEHESKKYGTENPTSVFHLW